MSNPAPRRHIDGGDGRALCGSRVTESAEFRLLDDTGDADCERCLRDISRSRDTSRKRRQRARIRAYHRAMRRLRDEFRPQFEVLIEEEFEVALIEEGLVEAAEEALS